MSEERGKQMTEQEHPNALQDLTRGLQPGRDEPIHECIETRVERL